MNIEINLFDEASIDEAVKRLDLAIANMDGSCEQMAGLLAQTANIHVMAHAPEASGDLKRNLEENFGPVYAEEPHRFVWEWTADVEAGTRRGYWRERHRKSLWQGEHYAADVEFGNERKNVPAYNLFGGAAEEIRSALPVFIQAVRL